MNQNNKNANFSMNSKQAKEGGCVGNRISCVRDTKGGRAMEAMSDNTYKGTGEQIEEENNGIEKQQASATGKPKRTISNQRNRKVHQSLP